MVNDLGLLKQHIVQLKMVKLKMKLFSWMHLKKQDQFIAQADEASNR